MLKLLPPARHLVTSEHCHLARAYSLQLAWRALVTTTINIVSRSFALKDLCSHSLGEQVRMQLSRILALALSEQETSANT
jgi:ABC-type hemin transport system ATPase subunit